MPDRVLSKEHEKKRRQIAALLKKHAPKGKRGFGSEVDRLAIDVLYELVVKKNLITAMQLALPTYTPNGDLSFLGRYAPWMNEDTDKPKHG